MLRVMLDSPLVELEGGRRLMLTLRGYLSIARRRSRREGGYLSLTIVTCAPAGGYPITL